MCVKSKVGAGQAMPKCICQPKMGHMMDIPMAGRNIPWPEPQLKENNYQTPASPEHPGTDPTPTPLPGKEESGQQLPEGSLEVLAGGVRGWPGLYKPTVIMGDMMDTNCHQQDDP